MKWRNFNFGLAGVILFCIAFWVIMLWAIFKPKCEHFWKPGVSMEAFNDMRADKASGEWFYYTCTRCDEYIGSRCELNAIDSDPNFINPYIEGKVKELTEYTISETSNIKYDNSSDPNCPYRWSTDTPGLTIFDPDPNITFSPFIDAWDAWDSNLLVFSDYSGDVVFAGDGPDIVFHWEDGKFNVIWDSNSCTEQANMFLTCLEPYLNPYIEERAKELMEIPKKVSCITGFTDGEVSGVGFLSPDDPNCLIMTTDFLLKLLSYKLLSYKYEKIMDEGSDILNEYGDVVLQTLESTYDYTHWEPKNE